MPKISNLENSKPDEISSDSIRPDLTRDSPRFRSVDDPASYLNRFILLVSASSFALAFYALFSLLLKLEASNVEITQPIASTADFALPYLLIAALLLVFGGVILGLRARLVREKLAWAIIFQRSGSREAFEFATPIVSKGKPFEFSNALNATGEDEKLVAAGEWVLDRLAADRTILAIKSKDVNFEKLKAALGNESKIEVLHNGTEKNVGKNDA